MKKKLVGIVMMLSCAAGLISGNTAIAAETETAAVRAAAGQFYSALDALFTGEVGPMIQVWSHADDVTYMGPGGGFQVGWAAVLANLQAQANLKLGGKVGSAEMQVTAGSEIAVINNYERGENTNAGGTAQVVALRATSIFRKENGAWKMIGHHTDTLPYLKK